MSMFTAWAVFPVVLSLLCLGLGLLVDQVCGRQLPGTLLAPAGLAAIVVLGEFTTLSDATAELTVPLVVVLAVVGAALSLPSWRFGRPNPWCVGAAFAVFAVFAAPVVLSGEPTFAGFIKLDDTATWLALTDRIMEHGRSLSGLEPSTYHLTLKFNLASGYPIGAFLPLGTAQKLVGGDLAWVFQPYLAFLATMLSLGLWEIFRKPVPQLPRRAFAAFLGAQPALLFGYVMWGGVKEVAAAAMVALAAGVSTSAVRNGAEPRDALPLALAAGALVGVLSLGGLAWLGPMLLALGILAIKRFPPRKAAMQALAFVLPLALFVAPVVSAGLIPPTSSPLTDPHAEGNLRGALSPFQALGIWPNGDFRFDPHAIVLTATLIGLGLAAAGAGLWIAWARRHARLLLYATSLLAGLAIVVVGSPWAGGKALATVSPVVLSLATVGALAALSIDRIAGAALVGAVAIGVLWSNALAYQGAWLAPYGELHELQEIGEQFAGEGPTLMTEYGVYGSRHFLRNMDEESVSELRPRSVPLRGGGEVPELFSADVDELAYENLVHTYRTLVLRRSPAKSRPPSLYKLVWSGNTYEVWQRPESVPKPLPVHIPLGSPLNPAAIPNCGEVEELAAQAHSRGLRNVRLLAARRSPVYNATEGTVEVQRPGTYVAWLMGPPEFSGSISGRAVLYINGQEVSEVRDALENEGSYVHFDPVRLEKGLYEVALEFPGADLHPGSATPDEGGTLLFAPARELDTLVSIEPAEASRLCGRRWDWIEAAEAP